MKMSLTLMVVGVCALTAAVLSYALGLAQAGTTAGIAALLLTGAGLAGCRSSQGGVGPRWVGTPAGRLCCVVGGGVR
ncbi:Uncharacterised protein [Mycobacteroides abscessus subsp. abscessus]|nr:Uncharacterised protein [Mycobacteroides abscessus subsp. abscessus]SIH01103.1 Uncharacterised protein [Mycobacteroides abscessus subsp. abscessus]SIH07469.1 Uncharacterised protein [Mycobacteroides abscessus subsp. abscessus]SIH57473.1 Uncharacterised protein [Mycobacteroides abscessus subsp. abscessus]